MALITHAVYFYTVINFTNIIELTIPTWCVLCISYEAIYLPNVSRSILVRITSYWGEST